jgi:hypothetical protein
MMENAPCYRKLFSTIKQLLSKKTCFANDGLWNSRDWKIAILQLVFKKLREMDNFKALPFVTASFNQDQTLAIAYV